MGNRNIIVGLECYVKKGKKYLMLHRHPNKKILPNVWMAPGGKIEPHEGLYECARREILEETGLKIKNIRLKSVGHGYLKDLDQEIFFYFLVADWAGGKLISETDVGELAWFTPDQIYKLDNLLEELHQVLPLIFRQGNRVISYKCTYDKGNHMTEFVLEESK
jgi:8-oxo-dGTP diphosphatase